MQQFPTILVTGGAGFIGANFVQHMIGSANIVNLDALTYAGNINNLTVLANHPRHFFVHGDIGDRLLVGHLLNHYQVDAIVHFAAETHVDRSIDNPGAFIQTNIVGTYNLLEAAICHWRQLDRLRQNAFRFLQVSTDEVYGSLGEEGYFTEATAYQPNSPYAASKAAADHLVRSYHHTYDLPVLLTNCSNNYGPYQFPEKLIPLMISNALGGKALSIYGNGGNIRDWLYVKDHCAALAIVLREGKVGESYNIGGNNEQTNLDVVDTLCGLLDELQPSSMYRPHSQLKQFVTDRPGHDFRYAIDASKIKTELGWSAQETFATGLRKTIQWYLDNPEWWQNILTGRYRGERLGLNQKTSEQG